MSISNGEIIIKLRACHEHFSDEILPSIFGLAADRIEALEAALRRTEDHMRGFAEISPLDRTAETEAIIYCNAKLLQGA
jgi:hypothetical protein